MTSQDQPSNLERIEAAIEADRAVNREWFAQMQRQMEQLNEQLERQIQFNAGLRTSDEILRNRDESRLVELSELRRTAEVLLQIVQIHQQDIEHLATEFRQHRSDGHGA